MTRQNQTNPDSPRPELTPQQAAAVDLLAVGRTITEVADAIGVTRQTVSGWLNQQAGFQAALNRKRHELWDGWRDRLRALLTPALDVIQSEFEKGNLKAALEIVKTAQFEGLRVPNILTEAEDIEIQTIERENNRRQRALFASLG